MVSWQSYTHNLGTNLDRSDNANGQLGGRNRQRTRSSPFTEQAQLRSDQNFVDYSRSSIGNVYGHTNVSGHASVQLGDRYDYNVISVQNDISGIVATIDRLNLMLNTS